LKDTKILFNYPGFKKIEENIWVISNFLTKEEISAYMSEVEKADESEWWVEGTNWYEGKVLTLPGRPAMEYADLIVERFKKLFMNHAEYTFGCPMSIHRMQPEQEMFVHSDYPELDDFKEECVLFNVALYHNEFEGGALYYPGKNFIEYKPEAGDLLIHPGTTEYRHGVRKVTGDKTRYMSNLWVADKVGMSIRISGNA
jgi:hypothetical protein